jgi:two-component system OmpR family sensor kinase
MRRLMKKTKTSSLRYQLLSRFFIILVILLVIIELSQYFNMKKYLYSSKEELLQSRFNNLEIKELLQVDTQEAVLEKAAYFISKVINENMSVSIINNAGTVISSSNISEDDLGLRYSKKIDAIDKATYPLRDANHTDTERILIPIPKFAEYDYIKIMELDGKLEGTYRIVKDEDENWQMVLWSKIGGLEAPSGLIQLSTTITDINDILYRQLYVYIGASLLILIIGGILGVATLNYTLRPLYNMASTVERINVEQLDIRLPVNNNQIEVDKLSIAFNNMIGRLELSFQKEQYIREKMREFVSNASHELRTPLTSIHGFVEVLLMGAAKDEKKLDLGLNTILSESERLTKLVNDLLFLTKLDQEVTIEISTSDFKDIIEEIYPQLQILAGSRRVELDLKDNILVNANRNQIKQVVFNLVQNAIQHTDKKNGLINITIDTVEQGNSNYIMLKITDNGTGIPKEHLNEIFDRFFRSESHRSRKHGGYGLGLSIVKSIVEAHEGKIEVKSDLGYGTTFLIYFREA